MSNSNDTSSTFWSGFAIGLLVCAVLNIMPFSDRTKYANAINECEKTLPRDQHCKVIGVVDNERK